MYGDNIITIALVLSAPFFKLLRDTSSPAWRKPDWRGTASTTKVIILSIFRSTSPPPLYCVIRKQTTKTTRRNKRRVWLVVGERESFTNTAFRSYRYINHMVSNFHPRIPPLIRETFGGEDRWMTRKTTYRRRVGWTNRQK